MEIDEDV